MKTQGNTVEGLDVGKMIRAVMFAQGMNKARLSRRVNRDASGLKRIIFGTTMQTYLVWEIGTALKHNFFADLAQQFRTQNPDADTTHPDELAALRTTVEQLRLERDYLRKAIDMLGVKTG